MKFGIFYEHQLPRPWGPKSEYQLLQDSLTQIELADRLGYDYAWEVEHHFLEEYSHSSAPEVFLGAASQRTKRIRLGHGVIQLTTNNPHRVAEKVATLDLLSGGRVELGMGEAAGPAELHPFGIKVRDKRERWEEAVKAIVPMFTKESWEFHGEYYDFPARNVVPKPLQKPHPPLWVACSNIATIGKAGEWGMGALGFTFVTPEAARAWVHKYYNNLLNNSKKLADYPSNPNVAMVSGFMCAATDEEAQAKAAGWTFFIFALSYYGRKGVDAPGTSNLWDEYQAWRGGPEEKKALEFGPDRLACDDREKAPPVPGEPRRPGDPAQPGRQDQPPGYLRVARAVRQGSDAGIPCRRGRARGLETEGARPRDRARGPRCRQIRHLQPPERTHRPPHARAAEAEDGGERSRGQTRLT